MIFVSQLARKAHHRTTHTPDILPHPHALYHTIYLPTHLSTPLSLYSPIMSHPLSRETARERWWNTRIPRVSDAHASTTHLELVAAHQASERQQRWRRTVSKHGATGKELGGLLRLVVAQWSNVVARLSLSLVLEQLGVERLVDDLVLFECFDRHRGMSVE